MCLSCGKELKTILDNGEEEDKIGQQPRKRRRRGRRRKRRGEGGRRKGVLLTSRIGSSASLWSAIQFSLC